MGKNLIWVEYNILHPESISSKVQNALKSIPSGVTNTGPLLQKLFTAFTIRLGELASALRLEKIIAIFDCSVNILKEVQV